MRACKANRAAGQGSGTCDVTVSRQAGPALRRAKPRLGIAANGPTWDCLVSGCFSSWGAIVSYLVAFFPTANLTEAANSGMGAEVPDCGELETIFSPDPRPNSDDEAVTDSLAKCRD